MKKRTGLLFCLLLIVAVSYGQKLKLRLEPGMHIPITSYSQIPTWKTAFNFQPLPNQYFFFEESGKNNRPFDNNTTYGITLGYETRNKAQFELGYHPWEGPKYFCYWHYNDVWSDDPETGVITIRANGLGYGFHVRARKIRGTASFPINKIQEHKGGIQVNYTLGGSWMWIDKRVGTSITEWELEENYYPEPTINIVAEYRVLKRHTILLNTGLQASYYSKKREWLSLKLFYEHGLYLVDGIMFDFTRNKHNFTGGAFSRGSAFHLKLSVPIDLYSFNKQKRDQN
jgi:hypothetical protein